MTTIESNNNNNSANTGLNKLLPKSISSKRLRRKQIQGSDAAGQDDLPDNFIRSQPSRETLGSDETRSSGLAGDEDGNTSLQSFESDES